ncbi:MAG: PIN domain-containing protein [Candidatus Micrarchaeota archaeon]
MASRPVVLDTNFLLIPFRFRIDILKELDYLVEASHHFVISSKSMSELKKIAMSVGKDGMAARLAIKLVKANPGRIRIIEDEGYVDDWIADYASKSNAMVCTNDSKLRKRLRELDIKVITLKSKSKLGFV